MCYGSLLHMSPFLTIEDICIGLKKLASRKEAHTWISDMFNDALQHGMPYDWTTNWIKPLYKGGDVNNVNNYRTIWMYNGIKDKCMG